MKSLARIFDVLEKTANKIARWKNHRHFNVRCVHSNVTPNSIRLKSNIKGTTAQKILKQAEKKLTNLRISQCSFTINKLEDRKKEIEDELFKKLSAKDREEVQSFVLEAQAYTFESTKTRQRQKFDQLMEKNNRSSLSANEKKYSNITKRFLFL